MGCHALMDPVGLALDNFSAIGAYRTEDDFGYPVDASGVLQTDNGEHAFDDARSLALLIKADPALTRCMVQQMATYALGRAVTTEDTCHVDGMMNDFQSRGLSMEALLVSVATSPLFMQRTPELP